MIFNFWSNKEERATFLMGIALFLIVALFMVLLSLEKRSHREEINRKSLEYGALNTLLQDELMTTMALEIRIKHQLEEINTLNENMDRFAALQPILPFVSPAEAFMLIDDLPPSSPFNSYFKVTARFGEGSGYNGGYRTKHIGTDIVPEGDWYVRPLWDGIVVEIGIDYFYGKFIVIDHGNGVRTRVAHLETIYNTALPETIVTPDTIIGFMGSTGHSDAAHLHIELIVFGGDRWIEIDIFPFLRR